MTNWLDHGKASLEAALNFIYPPVCQICGQERAGTAEGYVGVECWSEVRFISRPFCERCGLPYPGHITHEFRCENCAEMELSFSSARSAVAANALVLEVIHRYKYNRAVWFEPFLADLLLRQAVPALRGGDWDMIAPVPLHPVKEREREFNQAHSLARQLGRALGLPVNERLVRRVKFTETQTRLTRPQRAANLNAAFAPAGGKELDGAKVILVDDVLTTGATTDACARALRQAGASDVCVWTVARAGFEAGASRLA